MNRSERERWLKERKAGIGASEAAAVLGLDPRRSPLQVWLDKTGRLEEPNKENELLAFGKDVEPALARAYERATGRVVNLNSEVWHHPKYEEVLCTPDALTDNSSRLVQFKWETRWSDKFGDPGSDQVPDAYMIQCAHEMAVVGFEWNDLSTMHAGPPIRIYPLHRDRELEEIILDRVRSWWSDYVLKDVEPPIDASPEWNSYIQRKFPESRGEIVKVTEEDNPIMFDAVREFFDCEALADAHIDKAEFLKNQIKSFIADRYGLETMHGKITWGKSKDTTGSVTNWTSMLDEIGSDYKIGQEELAAYLKKFTTDGVVAKKGSRRFLAKAAKREKGELIHARS